MAAVNPYRGEVALTLDGREYVLRLTLGALAELEETLAEDSLISLIQRFETNGFSARDLMALLLAGLRGGGHDLSAETLAHATIEGGPMAATRAAAELLARSFVGPK
ncbi:gene transfer agent family protein [Epibacterium sp. SM1979]|uniref:Gene transfer agent family protein n=1 Tax=Tritonibacter litoralis TaxID=2662264 RepID=A0A843YC96_9RHOB|nr:gene transfer agent family protein [Tritonibacter litoralis]MQQ06953.1 gene transfer agent family protein [Tritonibacter litoralis]